MQLCSLILPNHAVLSVPRCSALDQKTARKKAMTPKKKGNESFFTKIFSTSVKKMLKTSKKTAVPLATFHFDRHNKALSC